MTLHAVPHAPAATSAQRIAELATVVAELAAALAVHAAEQAETTPAPVADDAAVLLDLNQAAKILGISRAMLAYGPVKNGELRSVCIGSKRLVPREAIDEYLADLARRR